MAKFLGTDHHIARATHAEIGRVFPDVVWHTETPIMRTSPAPMFLLSRLVREHRFKVVLTGEGADEFLGGYDIFKEANVRRFWARQPASAWRLRLFQRLYPDVAALGQNSAACLAAFFRGDLTATDAPTYSHAVRWRNNRRTCRFFSEALIAAAREHERSAIDALESPATFHRWGPLERAQFLEATIFMSQYLLSSQGDRVAMAHSVEGRFPFLDHRIVEFATRLPSRLKLRGLKEKILLRRVAREWLPIEVSRRPKRPYRAPIHRSFFNAETPGYVRELLSPAALTRTSLFKPDVATQLVARLDQGQPLRETDDMALAGILSAQLLHHQFIEHFRVAEPLSEHDDVKVCHAADPAPEPIPSNP